MQDWNRPYLSRRSASTIAPWLALALILVLRCTRGLDLSDEMQYYGQIAALVQNDRLFATDLYIQQLVYVLFYPAFKAHAWVFQQDSLILFGRTLMALLLLGLFAYARQWFLSRQAGPWQAGFAALALTFAVPYHGIFALSYNTVSQIGWAVFLLWFADWKQRPLWHWVALILATGFAHPTAALVMAALVSIRLIAARDWRAMGAWLVTGVIGCAIGIAILLMLTNLAALTEALAFSRGYVTSSLFFSDRNQWMPASLFLLALLMTAWTPASWLRYVPTGWLLVGAALYGTRYLLRGNQYNGYTDLIMEAGAVLVALAVVRLAVAPDAESANWTGRLRWLALGIGAHLLTLVITSSNGIGQGTGAMMLALPLLVGMWQPAPQPQQRFARRLPAALAALSVAGLFAAHWSTYPYRDARWYRLDADASSVPAFRHIRISAEHAHLLDAFRNELDSRMSGQHALIVSEYPALYFALNLHPETCMLYMHSMATGSSAKALQTCLSSRHPTVMLDVYPKDAYATESSRIKVYAREFAQAKGWTCTTNNLPAMPGYGPLQPEVRFRLCK